MHTNKFRLSLVALAVLGFNSSYAIAADNDNNIEVNATKSAEVAAANDKDQARPPKEPAIKSVRCGLNSPKFLPLLFPHRFSHFCPKFSGFTPLLASFLAYYLILGSLRLIA